MCVSTPSVLEDTESQPNEYRYISWVNGGRSFQINNRELFEKLLMPLYFKATKLRSFQRQLNLWGFERTQTASGDSSSSFYSHHQFIRGQPENLRHILRVKIKGSIGKTDINTGGMVGDTTGDHVDTEVGEGEEGTDTEMEISSSINEFSSVATTRRITLIEDGDTKNKMKMPRRRASLIGPPSPSTLRKSLGYPTTTMKRANDMYTRRASDPTPYYHTQQTQYNDMKNFNWSAFMADDSNMEPTTTDKLPAANVDEFASLLKSNTHPLDVPSASIPTNQSEDRGMMNFNVHPVSFDQVQANTSAATLPLSNGTFPSTKATCISEALATDVDVESILPISIKDFKPLPFECMTNEEELSRDLIGNANEEKIKSEEEEDDDDEFGMFIDKSIHKVQTF